MKVGHIYKIKWTDACGLQETGKEWHTIDELKEIAEEKYNDLNVSVGFIVEVNKKYVITCGSKAGDYYSDVTSIPVVNIVEAKIV